MRSRRIKSALPTRLSWYPVSGCTEPGPLPILPAMLQVPMGLSGSLAMTMAFSQLLVYVAVNATRYIRIRGYPMHPFAIDLQSQRVAQSLVVNCWQSKCTHFSRYPMVPYYLHGQTRKAIICTQLHSLRHWMMIGVR